MHTAHLRRYSLAFLQLLLILLCGCNSLPDGNLRKYDPPAAAAKAMEIYDANRDGRLAADELKKSPSLAESFVRLDTNRDNALTTDEIQTRFEAADQWPDYVGLDVWITSKGRPLVGAELTLTPEQFMGENYPVLSGTSAAGGSGVGPTDDRGLPGVPAGFYTVRIVHTGQKIDVSRGFEIASDTTGSRLEISL
jgi:hypothetical protein